MVIKYNLYFKDILFLCISAFFNVQLWLLCVIMCAMFAYCKGYEPTIILASTFFVCSFLFLFLFPLIDMLFIKKELGENTIVVSPDHLRHIVNNKVTQYDWIKLCGIHKTSKYFLIQFSKSTGSTNFYIPKKYFSQSHQMFKLCKLAIKYSNQAKKAAN